MDLDAGRELACLLDAAETNRVPIPALRHRLPDFPVAAAYAVQHERIRRRVDRGARRIGYKIGCTGLASQRLFDTRVPGFGQLMSDMQLASGAVVPSHELIAPRVELEIGFLMREELRGPGVRTIDVLRTNPHVLPCLEIVDSRIENWDARFADLVADNASSARCVQGERLGPASAVDLRMTGAVLERNCAVVSTGAGASVLGNPAASVAWLANALSEHGSYLRAGDLVLSGALTEAVAVEPGDSWHGDIAGVGSVRCRFAPG